LPKSIALTENGLRRNTSDCCDSLSEQFGCKRCRSLPCSPCWQDVIADVIEQTQWDLLERVFQEWINNIVIVMKVANRFHDELLEVESGSKADLSAQLSSVERLWLDDA
jgi:hypothetical protein